MSRRKPIAAVTCYDGKATGVVTTQANGSRYVL